MFDAIKEVGGATSEDFTHCWEHLKNCIDMEDTEENWSKVIDEMNDRKAEVSPFERRLANLIWNEVARKNRKRGGVK